MPTKKQLLLQQINELELQIEALIIELDETEEEEEVALKIGDRVRIKNPNEGQPTHGNIHKLHPRSQRATVLTRIQDRNKKEIKVKTVRMYKNLEKI